MYFMLYILCILLRSGVPQKNIAESPQSFEMLNDVAGKGNKVILKVLTPEKWSVNSMQIVTTT